MQESNRTLLILTQRISSKVDLSEILNDGTLRQLENVLVERDIKNTHPEIFDMRTLQKVNSFCDKATNAEDTDLAREYLLLEMSSPSTNNYIYLYAYINGVITTEKINLLYDGFRFNKKIRLDKFSKRIDQGSELWNKITDKLKLVLNTEDASQITGSNISGYNGFRGVIFLLDKSIPPDYG